MRRSFCPQCFEKQRRIDQLVEENKRLKAKLRYRQHKAKEAPFGSSTPSAKLPVKSNTATVNESKKRGARFGHQGIGRRRFDENEADAVVDLDSQVGGICPDCGEELLNKGADYRMVVDLPKITTRKILYRSPHHYCPKCGRSFRARPTTVLPRNLYGNQLIATVAVMHYQYGIPIGRISQMLDIPSGALAGVFNRLADQLATVQQQLIKCYRASLVRHADETGWRTSGKNGYAWAFVTQQLSLFFFLSTRSASVPQMVLGTEPLQGSLNVDRYAAYNVAPCPLQYCFAHLLRPLQDMQKEYPDCQEVQDFVNCLAPLLAKAMQLRTLDISDDLFYQQASQIKNAILLAINSDAQHQAVRSFQDLFRDNHHRLYLWADNRDIPADNNRAERDIRPIVIARKVSHGSQSDRGARTRSILMSVIHSLHKHNSDATAHLKNALDTLTVNPSAKLFPVLFPNPPTLD